MPFFDIYWTFATVHERHTVNLLSTNELNGEVALYLSDEFHTKAILYFIDN